MDGWMHACTHANTSHTSPFHPVSFCHWSWGSLTGKEKGGQTMMSRGLKWGEEHCVLETCEGDWRQHVQWCIGEQCTGLEAVQKCANKTVFNVNI